MRELTLEASRGQAQFAYFQLGLAASAIAFAVHETDGKALVDTPWPEGLAVLLWALSFVFGCFGVVDRHRGLITNAKYLVATAGVEPHYLAHDKDLQQAFDDAKGVTQAALDKPFRRFEWQLWMLFAGAMAYVAGHVMQMAETPGIHQLAAPTPIPKPQHGSTAAPARSSAPPT